MGTTTLGDKLRKNGKRPSCEPCRVRKQSCDHDQPCQRCQRHNRACFYAAAPMTKPKNHDAAAALPSPSSEGIPTPSSVFSVPAVPVQQIPKPPPQKKTIKRHNPLTLRTGGNLGFQRGSTSAWYGHIGRTSFNAILEEAEEVPCSLWESSSTMSDGQAADGWDDRGFEFCKEIMAWLPKRDICERVLRKHGEEIYWTEPIMWDKIRSSFFETFGALLDDGAPRKMRQVLEVLVRNTRKPLPGYPRTNDEWLNNFLGPKMRWDIVGHIFIQLGEVTHALPDYDSILSQLIPPECEGSKRLFACSMLDCADACLLLAEELDHERNVFTASLRSRCVCFQSVVQGDSSLELWKRAGAMVNTITGLGLHLEVESSEPVASLYLEFRASVFSRAFVMDKCIASFTGRPPALSRRYVTCPLELDLPPSVVYNESNHDVLKTMVDADGWAFQENPASYPAAFHRASMIMWTIRDEILEVMLGKQENLAMKAAQLRQKHKAAYDGLPEWLRREPTTEQFRQATGGHQGVTYALVKVSLRNTMATNCLLIERITTEGRDEAWMMQTAKFMLNNVLLVWNNRDQCVMHRDEIHWSLCAYGIPAASALALDLLRQTHSATSSSDRSEIIQQLSVFLVALDWVKEEDGNYVLCCRLGKMIKQILDRALNPVSTTAPLLSPSLPMFETDLQDFSFEGLGTDLNYFLGAYNEFDFSAGMLQM